MKDLKRTIIVGGLALAGVVVTAYRMRELKKLRDEMEQEIIDVTPEEQEQIDTQA